MSVPGGISGVPGANPGPAYLKAIGMCQYLHSEIAVVPDGPVRLKKG